MVRVAESGRAFYPNKIEGERVQEKEGEDEESKDAKLRREESLSSAGCAA